MCLKPIMAELPIKILKPDQPNYSSLGIEGLEPDMQTMNFVIDLNDIIRLNAGQKDDTVIELSSRFCWAVDINFDDFIRLYESHCGKIIRPAITNQPLSK